MKCIVYQSLSESSLLAACHGALLDGLEHVAEVTAQLLETGTDENGHKIDTLIQGLDLNGSL
jgi:hypothetical protein